MMNKLLDKAVVYAAKAHSAEVRKGSGQPYIFHPLEVMTIASLMTLDNDILCAAMLHDTVEDTDVTIEDIRREFNDRVAKFVSYESENKREGMSKEASWQIRKQETIGIINECKEIGVKIVCLSDKVSNLRSFKLLKYQFGKEHMFDYFNQKDPQKHYWYYCGLRDGMKELANEPVYMEYCDLIKQVFED